MNYYIRFLKFAKPYWAYAVAAATCLIASGFLGAYPVQIFKKAVDVALGAVPGGTNTFYLLALQYILLRVALGGVRLGEGYVSKRLVQNVVFDFRSKLYSHLQALPMSFYETKGTGGIMSRALGDVGAVAGGFMIPTTRLAGELTQLGWALFFLFRIDVTLTVVALAIAPPLGYAVYKFGDRMFQLARLIRQANDKVWSLLVENISGIREIKVFNREAHELNRFKENTRKVNAIGLKDANLNAILTFLTGLLFSSGEMVILLLGGLSVYKGTMTAGELTAFLMFARMLYNPVITISRRYDQTQRTLVSAVRVFDLLDTKPEPFAETAGKRKVPIQGEITFTHVDFAYTPELPVLRDVSFSAPAGSMVALVGPSGSGKTTLSKLLPRFYDPDRGRVLLDGVDLRNFPLEWLRKHIAVVFQEPFLFNGSVRDNIAFGKPDAIEDGIVQAAMAANAHAFVSEMKEGYDTIIGERGVKLSGGQRQRVAIARALLKDPRILILDEATSSVDTKTERLIQEALDRLLKGRTSFVIAHRFSTIMHADKILVVEKGRIIESGRHQELLATGKVYGGLYHAQFERQAA